VPSAPSGAQNEPGRTVTSADDTEVVAVTAPAVPSVVTVAERAMVVATDAMVVTVGAAVVATVVGVTSDVVVAGDVTATGGAVQPRSVVPAHWPESRLLTLPHSLSSIERFHRAFTETQFARYVHQ